MALTAGETGHVSDTQQTVVWVNHGATAGTARPTIGSNNTAAPLVIWVGSVEPTNALATDIWIDNS